MIRKIQEKDIEACCRTFNYYVQNSTFTFEETPYTLEAYAKRVQVVINSYVWFVYVIDEKVVGFAYLDNFSNRSAYRYNVDLSIYMDNEYKGMGIGKKLFDEITRYAKELGIKNIISIITDENVGSISFHETVGFEFVGYLKNVGYKFNKCLGVKYYQKKI